MQDIVDKSQDPLEEQARFSFKPMIVKAFSGMHSSQLKYRSWRTKAGILLVIASVICGFVTYAALTETPPFGEDPELVIWLLNIDLILLLLLVSLIAKRIVTVWSNKRKGLAGSQLHIRLVYIFSLLVAVPTIIMTIFSAFLFHYGVQAWFSQRVQTAINESQAVAQSYLEEHKQVIRSDTLAMANDIDRQGERLMLNEKVFSKVVDTQSFLRNLSEAIVINQKGRILARSSLAFSLEYEKPPEYALKRARTGEVALITSDNQDRVRALVQLNSIPNAYLFVGRMVDPEVLAHLNAADLAVQDYNALKSKHSSLQITVIMIFVVVGLLLLLAAIWSGLLLARQLVNPISELITAADRVRAGDLSSRLPDINRLEEFAYLANSFNRMTNQLQSQREELVDANRQIDRRRRLTETVLAGVSSGVIGVDGDGIVNLANSSASSLLQASHGDITGQYIMDILPELSGMLAEVAKKPKKMIQQEIPVLFGNSGRRTFLFRISIETLEENSTGLIVTFDDITDFQSAQRKAAWSDVARRIAHEIKNPLTPIQLSAERLQRKYLDKIQDNPETFEQCTNTIIKHVGDIGRMVDEFSSFARMPEAVLKPHNISKLLEEAVLLPKQAHDHITFNTEINTQDTHINCDAQQIRQVMTNLLKNAIESIDIKSKGDDNFKGKIHILARQHTKDELFVALSDNGTGFPDDEDIEKLTEPYVTHKLKGTGLGLAIVKKIIEDHDGTLHLTLPQWIESSAAWNNLGGACIIFTLPTLKITELNELKEETL